MSEEARRSNKKDWAFAKSKLFRWRYEELLSVVQDAYLKHHCNLDKIGWNELSDRMQIALCNAMGDEAFQRWLEKEVPDEE